MHPLSRFENVATTADLRLAIACCSFETPLVAHLSDRWTPNMLAARELGCEVDELGPTNFIITLPANTDYDVFMPSTSLWAIFFVGDYVLTIGSQQSVNRRRTLRRWTKDELRTWLERQPQAVVNPTIRQRLGIST